MQFIRGLTNRSGLGRALSPLRRFCGLVFCQRVAVDIPAILTEARLELSLTSGGSSDIHSSLASSKNDVTVRGQPCLLQFVDGIAYSLTGVMAALLRGVSVMYDFRRVKSSTSTSLRLLACMLGGFQLWTYPCGLVLGGGDEVCSVRRPLQVSHLHICLVDIVVAVKQLARLSVPLCQAAVLVSGDDVLGQVAEARDGRFRLIADYPQQLLVALCRRWVGVDLVYNDGGEMSASLLSHTKQLPAIGGELHCISKAELGRAMESTHLAALDTGRELPGMQQLASGDLPQPQGVVCAAGREESGVRVHVDSP
jgi:hypothetical protein